MNYWEEAGLLISYLHVFFQNRNGHHYVSVAKVRQEEYPQLIGLHPKKWKELVQIYPRKTLCKF